MVCFHALPLKLESKYIYVIYCLFTRSLILTSGFSAKHDPNNVSFCDHHGFNLHPCFQSKNAKRSKNQGKIFGQGKKTFG